MPKRRALKSDDKKHTQKSYTNDLTIVKKGHSNLSIIWSSKMYILVPPVGLSAKHVKYLNVVSNRIDGPITTSE